MGLYTRHACLCHSKMMFRSFQQKDAEAQDIFFLGVIGSNMFPIFIAPGAQKKPQTGPFFQGLGHFEHHRKPSGSQPGCQGYQRSDCWAPSTGDFTTRTTILLCKATRLPPDLVFRLRMESRLRFWWNLGCWDAEKSLHFTQASTQLIVAKHNRIFDSLPGCFDSGATVAPTVYSTALKASSACCYCS